MKATTLQKPILPSNNTNTDYLGPYIPVLGPLITTFEAKNIVPPRQAIYMLDTSSKLVSKP